MAGRFENWPVYFPSHLGDVGSAGTTARRRGRARHEPPAHAPQGIVTYRSDL